MYRYGVVTFHEGGEKGAKLKRTLIERMNATGVITVGESEIKTWYEEDLKDDFTTTHKFALHSKEELDIFKTVMESQDMKDPSIEWTVKRFERDRKLRKWIKGVEKRRKESST